MVDQPFRIPVEQRGRRMDIDGCAFDERLVAFLRVLLRSVSEEARSDCSSYFVEIFARRGDIIFVSGGDRQYQWRK